MNSQAVWSANFLTFLQVAGELDSLAGDDSGVGPLKGEAFRLARSLTLDILLADGVWQPSEQSFALGTEMFGHGNEGIDEILELAEAEPEGLSTCPSFFLAASAYDSTWGSSWVEGLYGCLRRMGLAALLVDEEVHDKEILALGTFLDRLRCHLDAVDGDWRHGFEDDGKSGYLDDPRASFPEIYGGSMPAVGPSASVVGASGAANPSASSASPYESMGGTEEMLPALLAELDRLTGLKDVKKEVRAQASLIRVRQMRRAQGLAEAPNSLHLVFTGNPGTGKTTVARLLARILRALGKLKKGHLIETDRAGLVAKYLGQTASTVDDKVNEALDGVLFIDEAYALTAGRHESDYGKEAVDALVKRMEDLRERLVVIVAGYDEPMISFIKSNPGLQSRFTHTIHFPDYAPDELHEILSTFAKEAQYTLTPEADKAARDLLARAWEDRDQHFGNAREVRRFFERAVQLHSARVSEYHEPSREDLSTITLADLPGGLGG